MPGILIVAECGLCGIRCIHADISLPEFRPGLPSNITPDRLLAAGVMGDAEYQQLEKGDPPIEFPVQPVSFRRMVPMDPGFVNLGLSKKFKSMGEGYARPNRAPRGGMTMTPPPVPRQ